MNKTTNRTNYNTRAWNILLLVIRLWLGFNMIKSGNSVIDIFTSSGERKFFENWFGNELHFPAPVLMAVLAKGSELIGGILLVGGIFTKIASLFIAFTMFVATITANLGENFNIDGGFTISYCLFASILIIWGGGKYSVDCLISVRKPEFKPGKAV